MALISAYLLKKAKNKINTHTKKIKTKQKSVLWHRELHDTSSEYLMLAGLLLIKLLRISLALMVSTVQ